VTEPTQRPRPASKPAAKKPATPIQSGVEATAAPEPAPEPTATQLAAERGAPAPRVPHEVREAQTAVLKAQPDTDELDLSDGEITGLSIRNELRRSEDGAVTSLRVEHRDGRLLDVSAGDGVLVFRAAR
jgi:hypothetical protein